MSTMTERRERQEETLAEMPARGRQKNPNKVAAGKKSAENRRKKQEEDEAWHEDVASRLARLEEIKQAMHAVPGHAVPANSELPGDDGTSEETIQLKEPEQPITIVTKDPLTERRASGWPIETIVVGGLGLAVIAHMVYKSQAKSQAGAARPNVARSVSHDNSSTDVPSDELSQHQPPTEVHQRDPFYME